jgi:Mg-chelatase subunit ChlD
MNEHSRGIEIVRQPGQGGFSITVAGESVSTQGKPVDIHLSNKQAYVYLVIDCSGSMIGDKLEQVKQGILDFAADALKNEYRVGLIVFETEARFICEPVSDIQVLIPGVKALRAGGSTNMVDAIKMAHSKLQNLAGTRVIVVATDGMPDNAPAALKAAQLAKNDHIDFIAIGTDDANQAFLQKLATRKELAAQVSSDMFAKAIASASNLLPTPRGIIKRQ